MYSTCLFCHASLGANQLVESFPTGRRLAFDAQRGRLWVVCRACERWNLSPLEERWEAIEQCERLFHDTRLRVSTENIGMARLREGLELIRVGAPQRPEMAAWRYGDQFGRRRRTALVTAGLGIGVLGAVLIGGSAAGIGLGGFGWMLWNAAERVVKGSPDQVVARLPAPNGDAGAMRWTEIPRKRPISRDRPLEVRRKDLARVRLVARGAGADWLLQIRRKRYEVDFTGEEAILVAGRLLPPANRYGGNPSQVSDAVGVLERAGSVDAVFADAARAGDASFAQMPRALRLALEMAAHEESERRALEGELDVLEQAWRDAEEVASISDQLLVPDSLQRALDRLRG